MSSAPFNRLTHFSAPVSNRVTNSVSVGSEFWPTLLVAEEDPEMLRTLVYFFEKRGYHVAAAASVAEAQALFGRRERWTMVVSNYHLPDGTGWELCCWMRDQSKAAPPFLLMSGANAHAEHFPDTEFLPKPFGIEELERRVRALLPGQYN